MSLDIFVVRDGTRLAAADQLSFDAISKAELNRVFSITLHRPRNGAHHRKTFALLNLVFQNQSTFATLEALLDAMKMATGLFDVRQTVDGMAFNVPRSISFSSMKQAEFEIWYDKVLNVIITKILPAVNRQELEAQVMEMIGGYSKQSHAQRQPNTGTTG